MPTANSRHHDTMPWHGTLPGLQHGDVQDIAIGTRVYRPVPELEYVHVYMCTGEGIDTKIAVHVYVLECTRVRVY